MIIITHSNSFQIQPGNRLSSSRIFSKLGSGAGSGGLTPGLSGLGPKQILRVQGLFEIGLGARHLPGSSRRIGPEEARDRLGWSQSAKARCLILEGIRLHRLGARYAAMAPLAHGGVGCGHGCDYGDIDAVL